jgi:hypothetical protein
VLYSAVVKQHGQLPNSVVSDNANARDASEKKRNLTAGHNCLIDNNLRFQIDMGLREKNQRARRAARNWHAGCNY